MAFFLANRTRRISSTSCLIAEERQQLKELVHAPSHEKAGKSSTVTLIRRFYIFAVGDDHMRKLMWKATSPRGCVEEAENQRPRGRMG
jgi:hypothetical protein